MGQEPQELFCHNCGKYVRFNLDLSVDDNYQLECPNCKHLHFREVRNGIITAVRWGQDPKQQQHQMRFGYRVITPTSTATTSSYDTYDTTASGTDSNRLFLHNSWSSATSTTMY